MPNTEQVSEMHNIVKNLVFSNLTIEQISKLPQWLLENIENNYVQSEQAISDLITKARISELEQIIDASSDTYHRMDKWYSVKDRIAELQQSLTNKEKPL